MYVCIHTHTHTHTNMYICMHMQSVSWACLAECPAYAPPQHGGAYPSAVTHEGDTVSVYCDSGYELRCADDSACDTATCQNDGENEGVCHVCLHEVPAIQTHMHTHARTCTHSVSRVRERSLFLID